ILVNREDGRGRQIRRVDFRAKLRRKTRRGAEEDVERTSKTRKLLPVRNQVGGRAIRRDGVRRAAHRDRGCGVGVWIARTAVGGPPQGCSSGSGERFSSGSG